MYDRDQLKSKGWAEVEGIATEADLVELANSVGTIIPHPNGDRVATLTPTDGEGRTRGTFSHECGYSSFPLHTDTAFWAKPARYLVLGMRNKSECSTLVLNARRLLREFGGETLTAAENSIYVLDTIEGKRYTSACFQYNGESGFRFDPHCMNPKNRAAFKFHQQFTDRLKTCEAQSILWTGNKAVILDNWNVVHGREEVGKGQMMRRLMRIYVENQQ